MPEHLQVVIILGRRDQHRRLAGGLRHRHQLSVARNRREGPEGQVGRVRNAFRRRPAGLPVLVVHRQARAGRCRVLAGPSRRSLGRPKPDFHFARPPWRSAGDLDRTRDTSARKFFTPTARPPETSPSTASPAGAMAVGDGDAVMTPRRCRCALRDQRRSDRPAERLGVGPDRHGQDVARASAQVESPRVGHARAAIGCAV